MRAIDWNHLRAFHETATTGSLSAAARQLGLTQPTLSRQVAALEAGLGVELFERVGRKLMLTIAGAELRDRISTMADAAESGVLAASGRVQEIRGRVCISATDTYAVHILPEMVEQIRGEAPDITVVITASNELSNLHRREADIAIRHQPPARSGLIGQHVRDTEAHFYASVDWIRRNGLPTRPEELASTAMIGFDDVGRFVGYLRDVGIPMDVADFRLMSDSSVVIWEMVRRGIGVAPMLREVAERTPGVVRLLPDMPPIVVPIWLVTHEDLHLSPRIRLVQRMLAEGLARTQPED
ncbi:LysR family transcriptional regulator [Roseinatronobacter alkalisoli]|uniref:LysR family transcriptional regulator n=1 Tax=Roseinatronobacter alkalisoli TaxID=3028235 RepID=A0ABT5T4M5_9RHOB|nr:LysR family transcriptional regulator [Roseinatronobacter sp. HJB301]MDD7969949.1 LysR family transcriptional regulator [Roseinatronobacter sp. HJB301]